MEAKYKLITIGQVCGVYGVKGWVRVYSYTRPTENILRYSPWYLKHDGRWEKRALLEGKRHRRGVFAALNGYTDRDRARELLGREIAIHRAQLPEAGIGEYYWADLIGLHVMNSEGTLLGTVSGLLPTGAHDVLVVRGERERLIPFIWSVYVWDVNSTTRRITVEWDPAL